MGCTGKVDLVATKDGIIKLIDVKTLKRSKGGICFRAKDHEEQRARGIVFLYVDKESEQVGWNRDYFSE
jgi:Holliday junction resolvase-like predicted endonuclease